jgi:hypothetical protein
VAASTPLSPKVTSGANWAAYATFALTLLNSINPDTLAGLGKWEPLVNGIIVAASYFLGAYLKEDPLRTAGIAAQPVAPVPAPPVAPVVEQAVAAVEPFIPAALQKLAQAPAAPAAPQTPSV